MSGGTEAMTGGRGKGGNELFNRQLKQQQKLGYKATWSSLLACAMAARTLEVPARLAAVTHKLM